jgi:hypothetical protein
MRMTSEQARIELDALRVPWNESALAPLERLSAPARRVGRFVAGLDLEKLPHAAALTWRKEFPAFADELGQLTRDEVAAVLAVLFPSFAEAMQRADEHLLRWPYLEGVARRAFRAPRRPELYRRRRLAWWIQIFEMTRELRPSVAWLARWAPWIGRYGAADALGILFASELDAGNREVRAILEASARGEDEIGGMGRHVVRGLLCCADPSAWRYVQDLLLSAQREEGLRQVILETIDEAHPEAFRLLLGAIGEHGLARFSSVARALGTWLGIDFANASTARVQAFVERLSVLFADPARRAQALQGDAWEAWYEAAWAEALLDVDALLPAYLAATRSARAELRGAAAYFGAQAKHPAFAPALAELLDDPDLRVAETARLAFVSSGYHFQEVATRERDLYDAVPDLFERLERQVPRWVDDKAPRAALLWPDAQPKLRRAELATSLFCALRSRPLQRLLPHVSLCDPPQRVWLSRLLASPEVALDGDARAVLLRLAADRSEDVREHALQALAKLALSDDERLAVESLLRKKSSATRRAALVSLLAQPDAAVLASARRLIADAKQELARVAGLELLRGLVEARRASTEARALAETHAATSVELSAGERAQLEALGAAAPAVPTLADALGLVDPRALPPPPTPEPRPVLYFSRAAEALLFALDALADRCATVSVKTGKRGEYAEAPLGSLSQWRSQFPRPKEGEIEAQLERWPLREVWEAFERERGAELRDPDGLELVRASMLFAVEWKYEFPGAIGHGRVLKYRGVVEGVLRWLLWRELTPEGIAHVLRALENALARGRTAKEHAVEGERLFELDLKGRFFPAISAWALGQYEGAPDRWTSASFAALYGWLLFHDASSRAAGQILTLPLVLRAFAEGAIGEARFLHYLLGERPESVRARQASTAASFQPLSALSSRRARSVMHEIPGLEAIVERCRARILDVELARGEQPTAATDPALALRWTGGLATLARVVRGLGVQSLQRAHRWGEDRRARDAVFSHLLRSTWPGEGDTREELARALPLSEIGAERLLEVAMFAPQWAPHVEHALGWSGLEEAIWWVHAHTKDESWSVDAEIREAWAAQTSERTPLAAQDLLDGGVDVAWFQSVLATIGKIRFLEVLEVARFAASGTGHTRARLFAEALLGVAKKKDLEARVAKRQPDAVRALGLLPLAKKNPEQDLLARYELLQEFLRTRKQFGAQRQASEKRAAEIGLENLARTAGYPDPRRLEWAMEARAIADLADGAEIAAVRDDLRVSLRLDAEGHAVLRIAKGTKELAALPAKAKKDEELLALLARAKELERQHARMRLSLEEAMLRGDPFTAAELGKLCEHALLRPMLSRLVLASERGRGYPVEGGRALRDARGALRALAADEKLRVAHPHDLHVAGEWHLWQRDAFARELVQPFKQIFRELYPLTAAERSSELFSRRYSGHQVQPKQALALLGTRGWIARPDEGISKTFHREGLTAWIGTLEGLYTPAEMEGLTLENLSFARRGTHEPLRLEEVPPRLFSEVMRDVDLVVSVAHRGGVDPEASASSIEVRAALARETAALVGLTNLSIEGRQALIHGHYGDYAVHLGSGIVHKLPGGMLCLVPVHAAQRGRLFLPFADDDPKTAEVLSKILLLARDEEIRDPNVLDQLRR